VEFRTPLTIAPLYSLSLHFFRHLLPGSPGFADAPPPHPLCWNLHHTPVEVPKLQPELPLFIVPFSISSDIRPTLRAPRPMQLGGIFVNQDQEYTFLDGSGQVRHIPITLLVLPRYLRQSASPQILIPQLGHFVLPSNLFAQERPESGWSPSGNRQNFCQ
jgi:hypothetical protein